MVMGVKVEFEKYGRRLRFEGSSRSAHLDVRDIHPSHMPGQLYHGGLIALSPSDALALASALVEWAEREKQNAARLRKAAAARKASSKANAKAEPAA